ncbi:MAG: tetraacyldisaccharide 4'-kinase [Calditrichaeota bacterium]|nr:tetraacyldisaccharide 4'-kinase [Calditrichota bacterium]
MRKLLLPFSILYFLVIKVRNWCYDVGILKEFKLAVPVISVGNLSTGGTGKTPFTIALISILQKEYAHIVVISRGYKRKSKGAQLVSLKGEIKTSVDVAGDEPYLIANRFKKNVSVVVAEQRINGFELIKKENPDLVILDDGFQHRSIYRDLDIVLMNGNHPYSKDYLLPVGYLREPVTSLKRANCLVITKKNVVFQSAIPNYIAVETKFDYHPKIDKTAEYIAVSAIANNQEFTDSLLQDGIQIKTKLFFPDHHRYSENDFKDISKNRFITTEKDYYKLRNFISNLSYRRIDIEMDTNLRKFVEYQLKQKNK